LPEDNQWNEAMNLKNSEPEVPKKKKTRKFTLLEAFIMLDRQGDLK